MSDKINIAIDGYSSCGKSTLTKQLATHFNYHYLDTGAMYRAVTYFFLEHQIDFSDQTQVEKALQSIDLSIAWENDSSVIKINGQPLEEELRTMQVSDAVSDVAALSAVRLFLVDKQREIAQQKGVVMDGRDIGTVVLPDAELKLFMVADKGVRVERRYNELKQKGVNISREEIRKNLEHRDYVDSHRKDSPLTKADDAILIDNSNLTVEQQFDYVVGLVKQKLQD